LGKILEPPTRGVTGERGFGALMQQL